MKTKFEDRTEMWCSGAGRKPWTVMLSSNFFGDDKPKLFWFKTKEQALQFLSKSAELEIELRQQLESGVRAIAEEMR